MTDGKGVVSSFRCIDDGGYVHPRSSPARNITNSDPSIWLDYSSTSCVFKNICLRTDDKGQFFPEKDGKYIVTMEYFLGKETHLPFSEKFQPSRLKWDASISSFDIQGVSGALHSSEIDIHHRAGLISDWCTYNLGHLLLDFMLPHYLLNLKLGNGEDYSFQLISTNPINPTSLEPGFGRGLCRYPMVSLPDIAQKKSNHSYHVCFREINIGLPSGIHTRLGGDVVYRYQQFLLKNMLFPLRVVRSGNLIVMGSKSTVNQHVGGRHYINSEEIKMKFGSKYSNFRLEEFVGLTPHEQIDLMQKASIFITPGGGGSFIGLFLPINSILISLDIYDYRTNESKPFASETDFWNGCTWMKVWRYIVTPDEYYCTQGLSYCQSQYHLGVYNLNLERLSNMIDLALEELARDIVVGKGW